MSDEDEPYFHPHRRTPRRSNRQPVARAEAAPEPGAEEAPEQGPAPNAVEVAAPQTHQAYVTGYEWIPGMFGPPPGIPAARKKELDQMSDANYQRALWPMCTEEKWSLMVSENERRRTFPGVWPHENFIKGADLAKEGFFFTGIKDIVQCTFCGGKLRNWEQHHKPAESHKKHFPYCRMVTKRPPCDNIPYRPLAEISERLISINPLVGAPACSEGIIRTNPKYPAQRSREARAKTFARFPTTCKASKGDLIEAGFIYEGEADTVHCFWCGGTLACWSEEDIPWIEHARWFPGCAFVRQMKGTEFIKDARRRMTPEDLAIEKNMPTYNSGDLTFLETDTEKEPIIIQNYFKYQICLKLGLAEESLEAAYELNGGEDFSDIQVLIDLVMAVEAGDESTIGKFLEEKEREFSEAPGSSAASTVCAAHAAPDEVIEERILDITKLVKEQDISQEDSELLVNAFTCKICDENLASAAILPCGHMCLCKECSLKPLPQNCPDCGDVVRGAVRAFMS